MFALVHLGAVFHLVFHFLSHFRLLVVFHAMPARHDPNSNSLIVGQGLVALVVSVFRVSLSISTMSLHKLPDTGRHFCSLCMWVFLKCLFGPLFRALCLKQGVQPGINPIENIIKGIE